MSLAYLLAAVLPHSVAAGGVVGLLLAGWGVARAARGRDRAVGIAVSCLGGLLLLALARGGPASAVLALRCLWPVLASFALANAFADDPVRRRVLVSIYFGSLGLLVAVWWLHLALEARAVARGATGGGLWTEGHYRYGFLLSRAVAGSQLALGAVAAGAHRRWGWFTFLTLGLFSTEARAAEAAWGVAVLVALGARRIPLRWAVGVFLLSLSLLTLRHPVWIERWNIDDPGEDASLAQRFLFWHVARQEWLSTPTTALFGRGWGRFVVDETRVPPGWARLAGGSEPGHPHNSFLQVLHDSGAVGLVLFLGLFAVPTRRLWAARASPGGLAGLLGLVVLAVAGAADKSLLTPMVVLPWCLLTVRGD